jgi:hypothetical protein
MLSETLRQRAIAPSRYVIRCPSDLGPDEARPNWLAIDRVITIENAHAILETPLHRRIQGPSGVLLSSHQIDIQQAAINKTLPRTVEGVISSSRKHRFRLTRNRREYLAAAGEATSMQVMGDIGAIGVAAMIVLLLITMAASGGEGCRLGSSAPVPLSAGQKPHSRACRKRPGLFERTQPLPQSAYRPERPIVNEIEPFPKSEASPRRVPKQSNGNTLKSACDHPKSGHRLRRVPTRGNAQRYLTTSKLRSYSFEPSRKTA